MNNLKKEKLNIHISRLNKLCITIMILNKIKAIFLRIFINKKNLKYKDKHNANNKIFKKNNLL